MVTSGSSSAWKYVNVPDDIKISVYFGKSYRILTSMVKGIHTARFKRTFYFAVVVSGGCRRYDNTDLKWC